MPKKITFDQQGSIQVTHTEMQIDSDGIEFEAITTHTIRGSQLDKHLPMFEADMTKTEKTQAAAIVKSLEPVDAVKR